MELPHEGVARAAAFTRGAQAVYRKDWVVRVNEVMDPTVAKVGPKTPLALTARYARSLSLDLPSCNGTIEAVDALVGEVAASAGFDPDSTQDLQIAAREAVTNAVVHGNRRDESRRVRLQVEVSRAGLELRVQDEGRGFDPRDVPDPRAPENLGKSSGRGILFMRSLVDEVRFQRASEGGTQVMLLKRRAGAADAARAASSAA